MLGICVVSGDSEYVCSYSPRREGVVSAEGLRADIAINRQQRSGGAEKLKGPPQVDNYHFSLFSVSAFEVTNSS